MAQKVGIDKAGLEADRAKLVKMYRNCLDSGAHLNEGIKVMQHALDGDRLKNITAKISGAKKIQTAMENYYSWALKIIDECIEKYESVDAVLAKYAEDLYNEDNNITNPNSDNSDVSSDGTNLKLQHNMTNPICQSDPQYGDHFRDSLGNNAGCCATAYATGLSIVNGRNYDPRDFWYDGITHFDAKGITDYIHGFDPNTVYQSLTDGKPTMFHFGHNLYKNGQHYVLITGVREGADVNDIKIEDFIVIDPATGTERSMEEIKSSYGGFAPWGYHLFV